MADAWDDDGEQERASPDFLAERVNIVGEGALPDQPARLADLYVVRRQGDLMAGLADLRRDLANIAEQNNRDAHPPDKLAVRK